MSRCRFVQPAIVRLPLVDVHRRAYQTLVDTTPVTKDAIAQKAKDLDTLQATIADAEADGDWIDVKGELNAGEQRHLFSGIVKEMVAGEKVTLDPEQVGLTKLVEYIVGWSFVNTDGRPEPKSEAAIANLDTETFGEISAAIDWHETQIEASRTTRKNARRQTTGSAAS